jgi:hypothetical protein
MLTVVHYVSLALYICVITNALIDVSMLRKCKHAEAPLKTALSLLLGLVLLQAGALVFLQLNWLYGDPGKYIGGAASLMWLAFDLLNGLVMLSYVVSIHVFLGWKTREDFNIVEAVNGINTKIRKATRR